MKKLITPYAKDFGKPNIDIKYFPDTESCVRILNINSLKNKEVIIYHRLYPEPEKRLFELLLALDRLSRVTKKIETFIPYLPYAQQDEAHKSGEVVSADVLCRLLKRYGVKKLITYDCHFLPHPGNFKRAGLNIENRSAGKQLFQYAKKFFGKEKFVVIAPDQGSSYFTENATLGHSPTGEPSNIQKYSLHKTRKRHSKSVDSETHLKENSINIKGQNICILDDIIETGGTILKTIIHLKEKGAKKIIVGATHGTLCRPETLKKILKATRGQVFVTDSIPQSKTKVKVLSLLKFFNL